MMNVTSVKRIHQSDWTDSGVRFLRARDIVAAAKNEEPDDYLYISKEKYEEYSALSGKVGVSDLLVTGVGTIGVPYLVRNLEPLYFKDGNIIWFQNSDKIDGKFLFYSFSAEQIFPNTSVLTFSSRLSLFIAYFVSPAASCKSFFFISRSSRMCQSFL